MYTILPHSYDSSFLYNLSPCLSPWVLQQSLQALQDTDALEKNYCFKIETYSPSQINRWKLLMKVSMSGRPLPSQPTRQIDRSHMWMYSLILKYLIYLLVHTWRHTSTLDTNCAMTTKALTHLETQLTQLENVVCGNSSLNGTKTGTSQVVQTVSLMA